MRLTSTHLVTGIAGLVLCLFLVLFGYRAYALRAAQSFLSNPRYDQSFGAAPEAAKVTIIEISAYRCAPCLNMHRIFRTAVQNHTDVRLVFHPLPSGGPSSVSASSLAIGAAEHGYFQAVHDILITSPMAMNETALTRISEKAGIDRDILAQSWKGNTEIGASLIETIEAVSTLGIDSIPAYLINNKLFIPEEGQTVSLALIERLIDEHRK